METLELPNTVGRDVKQYNFGNSVAVPQNVKCGVTTPLTVPPSCSHILSLTNSLSNIKKNILKIKTKKKNPAE